MTTLDRYLFLRLAATLMRTLLALVSIYILIDLLTHRRDNIAQLDIPWRMVVEYYLAQAPQLMSQMAPLALLVSALFVLGDAAQNNEVTAALAGGISLRRLVRMPVVLAALFAFAVFAMEQTFGATAAKRAERLERDYFSTNTKHTTTGMSWANLADNWTVHIAKFNRIALTGEDVIMHSIRDDAVEYIRANRIYWDELRGRWVLEDGRWSVFAPGGGTAKEGRRITQRDAPIDESADELFALERAPTTKTARELATEIARAKARHIPVEEARVDLQAKFSQPTLSFVMIWLAVPFAMRLRRGGLAISFGASIVIALVYLVVFVVGMQLGYIGRVSPVVAAWGANVVFLVAGLYLFVRTPT